MADYDIYVRYQTEQKSNTQPDLGQPNNTSIPTSQKNETFKNIGTIANIGSIARDIGKTYITTSFKDTGDQIGQAKFNNMVQFAGYGLLIASNPALGTVSAFTSILSQAYNYGKEIKREQLRNQYLINKLNLNNSNSSRYGGVT